MNPYAERRARLCAQMQPGAVAVLGTAPEVARNSDTHYPYRHDSHFYYLTGFAEPEAVVALVAGRDGAAPRAVLFCRAKNPDMEIWEGFRYGPEAARSAFGFDEAYPIDALDEQMARLLENAPAVYHPLVQGSELEAKLKQWLRAVRAKARSGVTAPGSAHDLLAVLDEMRLFKDSAEQVLMQRAADISSGAHARAMRATRPGVMEYEVEAELLYEFRRHGAQFPAYSPIVAAGANSCVLHYTANDRRIEDGDLVLIDAGCEFGGYAADITRTYPASGRFGGAQRELYEIVLAAQQAAIDAVQPGKPFLGVHEAALRVLVQGMLDTKLITRFGNVDDAIAERAHTAFYMHGTSHWLGMDVHDVGAYRDLSVADRPSRPLQPGMALTVEPGIYVRPGDGVPEQYWNIGIRIEDDVVVTPDGCTVLSSAPKSVADIEALMK
jgi:Xaa-Pro aminopeptidase